MTTRKKPAVNNPIKTFRNLLSLLPLIMHPFAPAHATAQGPQTAQLPEKEAIERVPIEASLDQRIRAVDSLLTEHGPVLKADLDWFKSMGYLCRRTKTDIVREMAKAEASISELEAMRRSGNLDAVRARRIAYTLGMEADALAKQAVRLEEAVAPVNTGSGPASAEIEHASRKRQRTVGTLSAISSALHELANAIVANLRKG